jgi:uncharacterized protein YkwD
MRSMIRTRLRLLAALMGAVAGAAALAVAPGQAHAGTWDYLLPPPATCGRAEVNAWYSEVDQAAAAACLVNAVRAKYGVPAVGRHGALDIAAYFKARDIGACQQGDPHTACDRLIDHWLNRYGSWRNHCTAGAWAENVFPTWVPYATARHAVSAWLNSDDHRRAMLNGQNTYQGINVKKVTGGYQGHASAQVWVNYFCY